MYERVYRHAVTRNAERILSVALCDAAENDNYWKDILSSFALTDDMLLAYLSQKKGTITELTARLRRRNMPKRAFAFSPDFYTPVVPYISIFSGISDGIVESQYYHEVISKDPFHAVVEGLKERSPIFLSNERHRELEQRITAGAAEIRTQLRKAGQTGLPSGKAPDVFFIPLPDHSATPTSCAIVTREGELESSGDYSRAPQLVSAKEIGRSVGFVTCEPKWAEIVFLAAQEILYDYFGNDPVQIDLPLEFQTTALVEEDLTAQPRRTSEIRTISISAIKRFYVPEHMASRRCRLHRGRLNSHRRALSLRGYYDKRPRLATPVTHTYSLNKLRSQFKDFSGQHGWRVTDKSLRQFLNQFPPSLRDQAQGLIKSINFLDRRQTGKLLKDAIESVLSSVKSRASSSIYVTPLAGTSAHVFPRRRIACRRDLPAHVRRTGTSATARCDCRG